MNYMVKQEATLILGFFIAECGRYQLWQIPPAAGTKLNISSWKEASKQGLF